MPSNRDKFYNQYYDTVHNSPMVLTNSDGTNICKQTNLLKLFSTTTNFFQEEKVP